MWKAAVFEEHSAWACVKGSETTQRPEGSFEPVDLEKETNRRCFIWWCATALQEQRIWLWKTQGCEVCCGNSADQANGWFVLKHRDRKGKILTTSHQTTVLSHYSNKEEVFRNSHSVIQSVEWKQRYVSSHITNVLPFPQPSERTHLQLHTNLPTSELTTTQPQLPTLALSLQPQKPQPTSTTPTLIIHGSRKNIHPRTVLSVWGVGLRFTRAHRWTQATDLLI